MAMQRQVPLLQTAQKTAEVHLVQYIDNVVDVPVDTDPGDAEDFGSCCTKCCSDVETVIDIHPDGVVTIAVQAQTTENLADKSLYFNSLSVEKPCQGPQVMTQEVMVPVAGLPRVGRSGREHRGADCGKRF